MLYHGIFDCHGIFISNILQQPEISTTFSSQVMAQTVVLMFLMTLTLTFDLPGVSVTAPWAFIWFLDGNEYKVDISIVGTNGNFFLINAHGVLRRMGAATEIPGMFHW